ncbi:MAG: hypothetical protein SGARI_004721 [Bacillariaceae sp.]
MVRRLQSLTAQQAADIHDEVTANGKLSFKIGCVTIRPFFKDEILWRLSPVVVILRTILTWISNITTLLILFGVETRPLNITGAVAIFLAQLVLHFSHGFCCYPSFARFCLNFKESAVALTSIKEEFEAERDWASAARYGDNVARSQWVQILITLVWTLPMHVAAVAGTSLCCLMDCLAGFDGQNNNNRAPNDNEDYGAIGILLACVFSPLFTLDFLLSFVTGIMGIFVGDVIQDTAAEVNDVVTSGGGGDAGAGKSGLELPEAAIDPTTNADMDTEIIELDKDGLEEPAREKPESQSTAKTDASGESSV